MKMTDSEDLTENRKITSGTKEWADFNVNCIIGCMNNCRYCYAKAMAKRFGRTTDDDWQKMKVKKEALNRNYRKRLGRVMFPSAHDIFDISPYKEACFIVLAKLLASDNDVLITTKPKFAVVQEISGRFRYYKDRIQFRFTITSIDADNLRFWEPNAPSFRERMKSLKHAWRSGFKTSVSAEPFLDYDPTELVTSLMPYVTESIWIGRMNYIPRQHVSGEDEVYYSEIRKNYETTHLRSICSKLNRYPKIRFKDSIRIQLSHATSSSAIAAPEPRVHRGTATALTSF